MQKKTHMNPNSFDQELKDGQNPNPEIPNQGTEPEKTDEKPRVEGEQPIDYQKKFAESSKEALRLYEENKKLQEELLAKANMPAQADRPVDNLYPGFEQLDEEAKNNLVAYTDMITKRTLEGVYKSPEIKFARDQYNKSKWDSAFSKVADKFPDLKSDKDEFKKKYFKVDIVPDNIDTILEDLAKIHLFDKAKDLGAMEEKQKSGRIELERTTGGDKTPKPTRSLEDWSRMAQENPAKFAQLSKEFNNDMAIGKI